MAAELIFVIVMLVLLGAFVVFGVMSRRRTGNPSESSTEKGSLAFKDCYDLCRHNPKSASDGCATMCAFGWP